MPRRTVISSVLSSAQRASSMTAPTMCPRSSVRTGSSIVFHVMYSQFNRCGSTTLIVPTGVPPDRSASLVGCVAMLLLSFPLQQMGMLPETHPHATAKAPEPLLKQAGCP